MFTVVISNYYAYKYQTRYYTFENVAKSIEYFNSLYEDLVNYAESHNCWIIKQEHSLIFVDNRGTNSFHQIIFLYIKNMPITKSEDFTVELPRDALCLSTDTAYNVCTTIFNFKKQEYHTEKVIVQGTGIFTYLEKCTPVKNALPGLWIANKHLLVDIDPQKPFEHKIFFITLQPIKKNFSEPIDKQFFVCYNDIKQEERN